MRMLIDMAARLSEVERRVSGMVRHGTVSEVDPANGRMRLDMGAATGGGRVLSPWVPYSQTAGALKVHAPPSVGQQFTLMSPSGDPRQGIAIPATWSEQNEAPSSAGDENVLTFGSASISLKGDALTITVGGVTLEVSEAGVSISGGTVTHNGKDIGDTHRHGGIAVGGALTQPPA